jgi:hypothetical protein
MSPAWSMLIQCGAVNDSPAEKNWAKGGIDTAPSSALSRDKSVSRSAQDDEFVEALKKNTLHK